MQENFEFIARSLRNMGVADADIDDAVQRTFIVGAERLDDIKPGAERSFLFQTALRVASHARRSVSRRTALASARAGEPPAPVETPEEIVLRRRQRVLLDEALEGLDEPLRAVFMLYEIEELTQAEIANLAGIPPGTVASRLRRARRAFQQRVRELSDHQEARTA